MEGLLKKLLAKSDMAAAIAIVVVVVMMIVPLPAPILDIVIALNISGALAIVISTMYMSRGIDFASFPSLLLFTTLLRLAINVSVTRLILLHGDAGGVIRAFGNVVVGGNLVVGLVVFFILIVIQFVVITNGAGRVAEVAARFTLDAMPGKQMAIDADLNAGQITDDEARQRRAEIRREADFYGAMDGASKFVKGDATAGLLIVSINLIGGIVVGVLERHMPISQAMHTFSLLTVGDGLAAQIPALLISTATGIIVTRSGSDGTDLGTEMTSQLLGQPRATSLAGAVVCAMGLVPGLPKLPFFIVGGILFMLGRMVKRQKASEALLAASAPAEKAAPSDPLAGALQVDPLEL